MTISQLLVNLNATTSLERGNRFVSQRYVKLNGFVVTSSTAEHEFHTGDVIQLGSRKFEVREEHLLETVA